MDDQTPRLNMPLLVAGQAQKEVLHNEALATLDLLVQPKVEAIGNVSPPADPAAGQSWLVGDGATGAWAGRSGQIAGWTGEGWCFAVPPEGTLLWVGDEGMAARKTGTAWLRQLNATAVQVNGVQVLGPRAAAIAPPAGGGTIDAEARAAIGSLLVMLKSHGLIGS